MVFNLEVDGQHVYHVAASGLLVHNSCDWQGSAIGAMSPTHIFSDKHVANGIDSLGTTRTAILEEVGNVLNNVDAQNLLKRGDNQIETVMNGQNATIRAFIDEDGLLRRINLWPGVSSRKLGNVIQW